MIPRAARARNARYYDAGHRHLRRSAAGCEARRKTMTHQCHCHIGAEQRVGEVVEALPEALEVVQAIGINHCCGRDLTLAEAAASAGVTLDSLLEALRAAREAHHERA